MMHHLTLLCCNTSLLPPNVGSWGGGGGGASIYIYIYVCRGYGGLYRAYMGKIKKKMKIALDPYLNPVSP